MKNIIIILALFIGFSSYAQTKDLGKVDKTVKKQLDNLLTHYFDVKDALVKSHVKETSDKTTAFLTSLSKVEVDKMTSAQQEFFKKQAEKLKTDGSKIVSLNSIEEQRDHFETLSIAMLAVVKNLKINSEPVYQQYCPMAFEGKGAFWLSNQKQIVNPYFGNKMLHCGSVKGEF